MEHPEVLQRLPCVRVRDSGMLGEPAVALNPWISSPALGECPLEVYVDGVPTFSTELNQVPPEWLDAMEVYLGS